MQAIEAELQPALPEAVFAGRSVGQPQRLCSREADRLGRLSQPQQLRSRRHSYLERSLT